MRAVLFHNDAAGYGHHTKDELLSALGLRDWSVSYCSTKDDKFDKMLRRSADLFIVAGGDGSVAKVVTSLPDRSVPLAIFPFGTANNVARSFGIRGSLIELAEELSLDRSKQLNIGSVRGPWGNRRFIEGVGFGPLPKAIGAKAKDKLSGADGIREGRAALRKKLRKASPLNIRVLVDGRPIANGIVALELLNVLYAGPALPLGQPAMQHSSQLDVVSISASQSKNISEWLKSPHGFSPEVQIQKGQVITIEGDLPDYRIDDNVFESETNAKIVVEVEEEPIRILIPRIISTPLCGRN